MSLTQFTHDQPIVFVLDTNIMIRVLIVEYLSHEEGFFSELAAADALVVLAPRQTDELFRNLRTVFDDIVDDTNKRLKNAQTAITDLVAEMRRFSALVGDKKGVQEAVSNASAAVKGFGLRSWTYAELEKFAEDVLSACDRVEEATERILLERAKMRVECRNPPCTDKKGPLGDCLVWEATRWLAEEGRNVVLCTKDSDFAYKRQELHPFLERELRLAGLEIDFRFDSPSSKSLTFKPLVYLKERLNEKGDAMAAERVERAREAAEVIDAYQHDARMDEWARQSAWTGISQASLDSAKTAFAAADKLSTLSDAQEKLRDLVAAHRPSFLSFQSAAPEDALKAFRELEQVSLAGKLEELYGSRVTTKIAREAEEALRKHESSMGSITQAQTERTLTMLRRLGGVSALTTIQEVMKLQNSGFLDAIQSLPGVAFEPDAVSQPSSASSGVASKPLEEEAPEGELEQANPEPIDASEIDESVCASGNPEEDS